MKRSFGKVMLFVMLMTLGVGLFQAAFADTTFGYVGGLPTAVPVTPNLFGGIDTSTEEFVAPFAIGHNLIQEYFEYSDSGITTSYLVLHPEFYPSPDDPVSATSVMAIRDIEVYDGSDYVNPMEGTLCRFPKSYVQYINGNPSKPYLKLNFQLVSFDINTGMEEGRELWSNIYFKVPIL